MASPGTLRQWLPQLLPPGHAPSQHAAWQLVLALLHEFTTNLTQLGRQLCGERSAKTARQFLARWLEHTDWEPRAIYTRLLPVAQQVWAKQRTTPLLLDFTYLEHEWAVLQVSLVWQRRALPLYRAVIRWKQGEEKGGEAALLRAACLWLHEHLPQPHHRFVLVMDRGMPSHALIEQCRDWRLRFVLRLRGEWKTNHRLFTGQLRDAAQQTDLVGRTPRLLGEVLLGRKGKGRGTSSQANVVLFHGAGHKEPWFLATSENSAARAVAIYRQRMRIEAEFRDLKGPWGLDALAGWQDAGRVDQFLAWVAVYEWWLALLWLKHRLSRWRPQVEIYGRLSWIRITREWIQSHLRAAAYQALLSL